MPNAPASDEAAAVLADTEGMQILRDLLSAGVTYNHGCHWHLAHQRNPKPHAVSDPTPLLGIFWAVTGPDGRTVLLTRPCTLASAKQYDDCLTSPDGHYEIWEAWRCGQLKLPLPPLAPVIATTEYETWPRGRIVFDTRASKFIIYADRRLLTPPGLTHIRVHFRLTATRTLSRADLHYRNTRRIGPFHNGAP